jgi:hypothetical protein
MTNIQTAENIMLLRELVLNLLNLSREYSTARNICTHILQSRKVQNSHCSGTCTDAYLLAEAGDYALMATFVWQPTHPP